MALNEEVVHKLFNKLQGLQKQIEDIQNELMWEINNDRLSMAEIAEVEAIRKEGDYRSLDEWMKDDNLN